MFDLRRWVGGFVPLTLLYMSACVAPPPPDPPTESKHQTVRGAARVAAVELSQQLAHGGKPKGAIWISPAVNRQSGEVTVSGKELQVLLALDLKSTLPDAVVHSLGADPDAVWNWIMTPVVEFEKPTSDDLTTNWFVVRLNTTRADGYVLPQKILRINAQHFDATPSKFYVDAPIYLTRVTESDRNDVRSGGATKVSDPVVLRRLASIESLTQRGIIEFEEGRAQESLGFFNRALKLDPGNLTALFGTYQSWQSLGNTANADAAFVAMIDAAVVQGNISFRFLFQLRLSEFRNDIQISRQYDYWLRHMADRLHAAGRCLLIQGHASRSGSMEYNDRLSLDRARQIGAQLVRYVPALKGKIRMEGLGFRNNLVGSGTDDAKDAVDRRVDFKLIPCS